MARFRCPSLSSEDLSDTAGDRVSKRLASMTLGHRNLWTPETAGPSKASRLRRQPNGKGKMRAGMDPGQKEHIRMAAKKEKIMKEANLKKEKAKMNRMRSDWSFLYVGNLSRRISEVDLQRTFSRFGKVIRVIIRMSEGCPVVQPRISLLTRERHYATVEFSDTSAARRAITLHGRTLNGVKLVVCLSAADLPETKQYVKEYIAERRAQLKKEGKDSKSIIQSIFQAVQQLTVHRTQILQPEAGPSTQQAGGDRGVNARRPLGRAGKALNPLGRRNVMGVSLAETLM